LSAVCDPVLSGWHEYVFPFICMSPIVVNKLPNEFIHCDFSANLCQFLVYL
jgi:hypothetical protein